MQGALNPVLGRHATWPAVGLIALYAMVGGATPAAVRASAMGGLAIAAAHLGRPTHVWTSLSLTAAAMLAWHPDLAWDVGFQLSFAGTAAIILLTPAIARRVDFLPHFLREPFAVTCAAQVGTLPMMATDFHVLSPVAPIANALTLPILPALVVAGLAIGAMSFVPELARFAAHHAPFDPATTADANTLPYERAASLSNGKGSNAASARCNRSWRRARSSVSPAACVLH